MNKFTEFLEKNVEWLALGLGGIFLLWMVWGYVITPPVTVTVGGNQLALGEVDRYILRGPATQLKAAMEQGGVLDLSFENVAAQWDKEMSNQGDASPRALPPYSIAFRGSGGPVVDPGRPQEQQVWVAELAVPPAPEAVMEMEAGAARPTHVLVKGVSQVPVPAEVNPAMPDAGAAMRNINLQGGNVITQDRLWVTLLYEIDMAALAKELADKKYYDALKNQPVTAFLHVEVERQELIGPDQWSEPQPVSRLPMNQLPPLPDGSDPQLAQQYTEWAARNTLYILKPPFYPTLQGVMWHPPGEPEQAAGPRQPGQGADTWQPGQGGEFRPDPNLSAEENRARYREWRLQQEQQNRQNVEPRRPPRERDSGSSDRPGRRTRRSRDDTFAPRDPDRPGSQLNGQVQFFQVRRGTPPPSPDQPMFDDPMLMDQPMPRPGQAGQQPSVIPQEVMGRFVPTANTPIVEFWVHDDSVQAGKTYRYRVRYRMLNPLYGLFNVARPESLQQVYALVSPWSEWSEPVAMDALSQYFVSGGGIGRDNVAFDVFKWENGGWQQARFDNVRPGDIVGGVKSVFGNDIDFSTGATVVDIRRMGTSGENIVMLMDSQGNLITRDFRSDQSDPTYRELQRKAQEDRIRLQQMRPGEGPAAGLR